MNFSKNEKLTKEITVLISPLDWGLGHATRCIPIIKQLKKLNCKVIIATDGPQKKILSEAFPELEIIFLAGYNVRYSKNSSFFLTRLLLQFPKIFRTVYKEQAWLKKVVKSYKIDAIISDNRFGLYHHKIPSFYITHQVAIKSGNKFIDKIAQQVHANIIKRFSHCWIPDFESINQCLAGDLSHPSSKPENASYIGCLSRFEKLPEIEKQFDIVAVVSGPEPQRSIFESLLLREFDKFDGKVLLVRGLPGEAEVLPVRKPGIFLKNHLDQQELSKAMQEAEIVICRSGYTSLMDLLAIKQKAILVPTPGQTEQEYLAGYLSAKKVFYSTAQARFNLENDLNAAKNFPYKSLEGDMQLHKDVIAQFVQSLQSSSLQQTKS